MNLDIARINPQISTQEDSFPKITAETRFMKPNQNGVIQFWASMKSKNDIALPV